MKHLEEYRDPLLVKPLLERIATAAKRIDRPVTIMEVCGSHTQAIGRYGLRKLLPPQIRLISGPGCPVCVTSASDVDRALWLAGQKGLIFATFGDMMRVPGTGGSSLQRLRAAGADVRVVASALDCLALAEREGQSEVLFMGIGFETTAPTVAAMVRTAQKRGIKNLSVLSAHKIVPPALRLLIGDPEINLDGFLCPGHVSIMLGSAAYAFLPAAGKAAIIAGFEPVDIIAGVLLLLEQLDRGKPEVVIQYSRVVRPEGNPRAMAIMDEVFETGDAEWRGLGMIPESGLFFRREFADFDAANRFAIPPIEAKDNPGCSCGSVLKGLMDPEDCPLFRKFCTPANPVGPCMVSSEGSCAAHYRYGR
ncbi:MAG: hydrogenase formation protein HypD [Deltaproteobacteria bacterium]|nr:hydrogenase formation protein HypD [Deltaproteobacteria bacterium]